MNMTHSFILVLVSALVTLTLRAAPFVIFGKKEMPVIIKNIANILPPAIMGVLVIYCLKDAIYTISSNTICSLISVACVVLIHLFKRNTLLSIATGTIIYMILIRFL